MKRRSSGPINEKENHFNQYYSRMVEKVYPRLGLTKPIVPLDTEAPDYLVDAMYGRPAAVGLTIATLSDTCRQQIKTERKKALAAKFAAGEFDPPIFNTGGYDLSNNKINKKQKNIIKTAM